MKVLRTIPSVVALTVSVRAASFTNAPDADAFVRAAVPTSNYGAAGALSVSGSNAVYSSSVSNGVFDTFIRFNTAAVTNFNSVFGWNNWAITHASLQVTEQGMPNNNIFNRGTGSFLIRWIANTNWIEGTGTPMAPTMNGICYTDEAGLFNSNTDLNLGIFTNSGMNETLTFSLALPAGFVNAMTAGGEVDMYLTAVTPGIGFTFNSRHFTSSAQWPYLEISAEPQPGIAAINLSGTNVVLNCTNGAAGETYFVLAGTNLNLPVSQWLPVATNTLAAGGGFAVTLTNAMGSGASPNNSLSFKPNNPDLAVRVLFFAQLKDVTKCDSTQIVVSNPMTEERLWTELLKKYPGLAGHRPSVRLARNCEYALPGAEFSNGDEVALIPPVSGG